MQSGDGERLGRQYTVTKYTSDNVLATDSALHSKKKRKEKKKGFLAAVSIHGPCRVILQSSSRYPHSTHHHHCDGSWKQRNPLQIGFFAIVPGGMAECREGCWPASLRLLLPLFIPSFHPPFPFLPSFSLLLLFPLLISGTYSHCLVRSFFVLPFVSLRISRSII